MAARIRKVRHDDFTRSKIQTSQLANRLTSHALGKLKKPMSPSQVTAAVALLKKSLPDLQSTTIKGEGKDGGIVVQISRDDAAL